MLIKYKHINTYSGLKGYQSTCIRLLSFRWYPFDCF